jgi:SAM-dependent methyltransferase
MGEVFQWLGTPEQRARRSLAGKLGRFSYFDQQLGYPDWGSKTVLDFGGNQGNLLMDRNCTIRDARYYCLDVLKEALEEGRKTHPEAHWVHYDRYNRSFNPGGAKDLAIPDMGVEFDIIVAFSVFTHTTREEMHSLVKELLALLAPGGVLAFTFSDPFYKSLPGYYNGNNLRWRLEQAREVNPGISVDQLMEQSRGAAWCSVVDGSELYVNRNGLWRDESSGCRNYDIFYTVRFLRGEFPNADIRPPVEGHMQHCCLIRR